MKDFIVRIKISVKQKHIKKGIPNCGTRCPVALAVNDQLNDQSCWVDQVDIYVGESLKLNKVRKFTKKAKTPFRVMRSINKFDNQKKMKPFNFFLVMEDYI